MENSSSRATDRYFCTVIGSLCFEWTQIFNSFIVNVQEGLEAPPEEEGLVEGGFEADSNKEDEDSFEGDDSLGFAHNDEEDLSYASMFANVLGKEDGLDPLSELIDEQRDSPRAQESKPFLGSIALGGLLASTTPSEGAFGDRQSRGILQHGFPPPPVHTQYLESPVPQPGGSQVLTPQELEAQLRSGMSPMPAVTASGPFGYPGNVASPVPMNMMPYSPAQGQPGPAAGAIPAAVPQAGVFTPEMIMQQQMSQQQIPSPAPPIAPAGAWQARPAMQPGQQTVQQPFDPSKQVKILQRNTVADRLRALNINEGQPQMPEMPPVRKKFSSRFMSRHEIESILHMQWKPLHLGAPYMEDYYYQAFLCKHYDGKNKATFAPESVRELAPTEKLAAESVAFVKLEGLGRVAFSNVRRPRPLMDLSSDNLKTAGKSGDDQAPETKRLEQEPALAARIMTEDCMALILDIQDVDRIFVASGGEGLENVNALKQRRTLLMDGLASSLRLSENPDGKEGSDGVFLRLLTLNKGRVLASKALSIMFPPNEMNTSSKKVSPNYRILWAILRNLSTIFAHGDVSSISNPIIARDTVASVSAIAKALIEALKRIPSPHALTDAMVALSNGGLACKSSEYGIQFFGPGDCASDSTRIPWLCDVFAALLSRGSEFGFSEVSKASADGVHPSVWSEEIDSVHEKMTSYLEYVNLKLQACTNQSAAERLRKSVPVPCIGQYLMQHLNEKQAEAIQNTLLKMDV